MKKTILSVVFMMSILGCSSVYAAQDNPASPPPPIENKMLESMVGTWTGQTDMLGTKMNDTLEISWVLNHQFLVMKLKAQAVNDPKNQYEGIAVFGLDEKNQVKSWWFDSWGAPAVATGKGVIDQNKMVLKDGNQNFQEERSFTVSGDTMTMHAKGKMQMNGKSNSYDQVGVYKRS